MGSNKSPSHLRGLLIPDPRFTFSDAFDPTNSAYTENTPRPGVPIAKDNSDLILETSGTTNSDAKYTIYTQNSGYPEDLGGTYLYQETGSTSTYKYYGWEPPHTINGLERVHTGTTGNYHKNFDVCTTLDDTLIIATNKSTTVGALTVFYKKASASSWTEVSPPFFTEPGMLRVGGARPVDDSYGGAFEAGTEPGPALCVLPSGRVLCFYWIQTAEEFTGTTASTSKMHWQIQAVFSDDSGASWEVYQNFCLIEPLSQLVDIRTDTDGRYYPGRLRAAYKDGQILMISSAFDTGAFGAQGAPSEPGNVYLQFASSSLGASFTLVEKDTRKANSAAHYDIAVSGGKFVISYITLSAAGALPNVAFLGSAYTPMTRADVNSLSLDYGKSFAELLASDTGNAVGRVDLSICAVPDGSMYLVGVRHGSESEGYTRNTTCIIFSGDNGNTWELVGGAWGTSLNKKDGMIHTPRFFDEPSSAGSDARDSLRNVAITWQRGRLVAACRYEGTATAASIYVDGAPDANLSCLYLGGYTNHTIGSLDAAISMADRGTFGRSYLPFVSPEDMKGAWTTLSAGSSSRGVFVNGAMPYYKISTVSGEYVLKAAELNHTATRNTRTEVAAWGGPMISFAEFAVECISGGSQTGHQIALKLTNGNEDEQTAVVLTFKQESDNTRVTVRDAVGDVDKFTSIISFSDASAFGEYRVLLRGRRVSVWWREYDPDAVERTWSKYYESASDELTIDGSPTGFCSLLWGHMEPSTSSSRWYKVLAGAHDGDLNHCAVPRMNDWMDFESPKNVGGRFFSPSHLYLKDGLQIAAKDGPAVKGDEWELSPRHDYPIESIHHEISPSPATGWKSSTRTTAAELIWNIDTSPAYALGGARALYLGNINFRYALLKAYDGSSWTTIATIDAAKNVRFDRKGKSVTARQTGATSDQEGDRIWAFNDMVGCTFNFTEDQTPNIKTISSNSGGVFESTGNTKPPVLIVDGTLSGGAPSSGDGQIWCKDLIVYLPDDVTTAYQKIKLEIPVDVPGVTGSGTNSTVSGNWEIGTLIWGHIAVFGRQYSNGHIRSIETNSELFTGTGGQRRAVERGPARRSVEFSWVDPIDISATGDTRPSPDYIQTTSGDAIVASVENTPFLVQGLLSRMKGAVVPVVFLPSLPSGAAGAYQIDDRHRFIYGRVVTASHRIENQIGEEWIGGGAGETVTVTALRIEEEV